MTPEARREIHSGHPDPYREDERWIRLRLAGWALIGLWQALSLVSEFVPLDLGRREVRIVAKLSGILGLVLVAYGFERLAHLGIERARARGR